MVHRAGKRGVQNCSSVQYVLQRLLTQWRQTVAMCSVESAYWPTGTRIGGQELVAVQSAGGR